MTLAAVLEKAKELDVPKEILDRNIKRASEKGQEAYIEKIYEVGVCIYNYFMLGILWFLTIEGKFGLDFSLLFYLMLIHWEAFKLLQRSNLLFSGIWLWWS